MTRLILALGILACAIGLAVLPAFAAPQCLPRDQMIATLATKYDETRRAYGLAADQTVMEIFASEAGSWSLVVSMATGMACLVAAGQGYEAVEPEPPGTPG